MSETNILTIKDCNYPWEWALVSTNGEVRPCCWMGSPVGDLNKQTMEEIWNGDILQLVRQSISEGKIPPQCAGASCPYIRNLTNGLTDKK